MPLCGNLEQLEALTLQGEIDLTAADDSSPKRFSMVAYNGGKMRPQGFGGDVIVDLAGLETKNGSRPVLLGHDPSQIVGHTESIEISANQIKAAGVVSGSGPAAAQVVESSGKGFPWRASIGAQVVESEFVEAGREVEANGRTFKGPVRLVRRSVLGEISFVPLAADDTTSAIAANKNRGSSMSTEQLNDTALADDGNDSQDVQSLRSQRASELERIANIEQICASHPAIGAKALRENWDATKCELEILKAERAESPRTGSLHANLAPAIDGKPTKDTIAAMFLCQAGETDLVASEYGEQMVDLYKQSGIRHTMDIVRMSLGSEYRSDMSPHEMLSASGGASTGSLPVALGTAVNKSLGRAFMEAPASWRAICMKKSVRDFKDNHLLRLSSFENMERLGQDGEVKHNQLAESDSTFKAQTWAKMVTVTRQSLINDDSELLSQLAPSLGRAAARTVNDEFATVLLANASSFFDASNSNYFEGAATNLQASSLETAARMLRDMKDPSGRLLDVEPKTLLVGSTLEHTARALLNSDELARDVSSSDRAPTGNTMKNLAALAVEPRISDTANFSGASTTQWYLIGGREVMIACFLNGREQPQVEFFDLRDSGPDKLLYSWRTVLDFGFTLYSPEYAVKSKGAA